MKLGHERIKEAIESYNNCAGGKWIGANFFDLRELEGLASQAMQYVKRGMWEDALRWTRRCIEMEKKVGFENAPIWGEFGETIERLCEEILKSDSN
ncbi:MAG: hypothetical protein ACTSW7_01545 [Candidatus Thorarchaeota archaeon]|nr:hypothetical protein [Thermoplasmatales archaeon]